MTLPTRSGRHKLHGAAGATLGLILPLCASDPSVAHSPVTGPHVVVAQATGNQPDPPDTARAAREQELEAIRAQQREAAEAEARLRREIESLGEDRRKLNDALISTAARLRAVEERISAAEARQKTLEQQERAARQSLDARRGVIVEILAALQRIGRRPPPAVLVTPEDALQSVRTAMLLGAVLPGMRAEAQAL